MRTCICGVGLGEGNNEGMAGIADGLCEHEVCAQGHGDDVAAQHMEGHVVGDLSLHSSNLSVMTGAHR